MIGLLFVVVLVSVVYEVMIVAIVVAGTRVRRAAEERRRAQPRPLPIGAVSMAAGPQGVVPLRASDGEREATATRIAQATAEGRLDLEEGMGRIDAAYRARDRTALERLVVDLPRVPEADGPAEADGRDRLAGRGGLLWPAALCTLAAAAVAQLVTGTWVLWPLSAALLLSVADRR